jgi:CubicO group peptidase (beta-lactamase class C family)
VRRGGAIAALLLVAAAPAPPLSHALDAIIADSRFEGVAIAGDGTTPSIVATPGTPGGATATWRWASVTKQLTATIVMQEVEAVRLDLDRPVTAYWPDWPQVFSDAISLRDLLRHTSGLADPNEDGPTHPDGMPVFYRPPAAQAAAVGTMQYEATHYCAEHPRGKPGGGYHYDNCDFIVLGALLERTTGKPFAQLLQERIAQPLGLDIGLFEPGKPPHPHVRGVEKAGHGEVLGDLGTYGAAGSAYGSPLALYAFDRALIGHRLLGAQATAQMWTGDPKLGAAALGQWQYSVALAGCAAPVSVVERRGQIGGIAVRNFILPESGRALVLFTRHGDFDFGEVWRRSGFVYSALSAVGCAT